MWPCNNNNIEQSVTVTLHSQLQIHRFTHTSWKPGWRVMQSPAWFTALLIPSTRSISLQQMHSSALVARVTEQFKQVHLWKISTVCIQVLTLASVTGIWCERNQTQKPRSSEQNTTMETKRNEKWSNKLRSTYHVLTSTLPVKRLWNSSSRSASRAMFAS